MITDALIATFGDVILFFLGEIEPIELPEWTTQMGGFMGSIFGAAASMGIWFNWGLLAVVVGSIIAVNIAAFAIQLIRIVSSYLTLGGGAT